MKDNGPTPQDEYARDWCDHWRRTGRTTRMLQEALPVALTGQPVVIVAHRTDWIRSEFEALAKVRLPNVKYLIAELAEQRLRGVTARVFVDHHAWTTLPRIEPLAHAVDRANARAKAKEKT